MEFWVQQSTSEYLQKPCVWKGSVYTWPCKYITNDSWLKPKAEVMPESHSEQGSTIVSDK